MNNIIFLHNPRCRKSIEAMNFLKINKIKNEILLYIKTGLEISFFKELDEKLSMKTIEFLRIQEKIW